MGRGEWASQRAGNGWMSVMGAVYGQIGGRGGRVKVEGVVEGSGEAKGSGGMRTGEIAFFFTRTAAVTYIYIYLSLPR